MKKINKKYEQMHKTVLTSLLIGASLFIFLQSCCKKKDECENINTNHQIKIIGEYDSYGFTREEPDTTFGGLFKAEGSYDSLHWQIGYDPTPYKNNPLQLFGIPRGDLNIQCIYYHKSNAQCFGGKETDTITKKIFLADSSKLYGIYRGVLQSAPNDTFNVEIKDHFLRGSIIYGLSVCDYHSIVVGYDFFKIYKDGGVGYNCPISMQGSGQLALDRKTLTVNFEPYENTGPPNYEIINKRNETFIGIKIQ